MEAADVIGAIVLGITAGLASGLLGIGGGALFVPALVIFLGSTQLEAEATSLLAIIPVAIVGAARQRHYGNLRLRDGLVVGVLSLAGVVGGTVVANNVPQRALELGFAAIQLFFAYQLGRRFLSPPPAAEPG